MQGKEAILSQMYRYKLSRIKCELSCANDFLKHMHQGYASMMSMHKHPPVCSCSGHDAASMMHEHHMDIREDLAGPPSPAFVRPGVVNSFPESSISTPRELWQTGGPCGYAESACSPHYHRPAAGWHRDLAELRSMHTCYLAACTAVLIVRRRKCCHSSRALATHSHLVFKQALAASQAAPQSLWRAQAQAR
jgi:hypothetical protein